MNRIFRVIFIFCFILFPSNPIQAQTTDTENIGQEIIQLEVAKKEPIKENIKSSLTEKETDEDIQKDIAKDSADVEFSLFDSIINDEENQDHPFKIEEDSLFGKIYKKKIERTSIPSYLLREELTFNYQKGIIDKVQFYGAYQGFIKGTFEGSDDYDTEYEWGFANIGAFGDFKNKKNAFKIQLNLKPQSGQDYLHSLFADMYIVNTSIPNHKIIIGHSRDQIGYEGAASSYVLPFATRSQIARNFGNIRTLGVRVAGSYPLVDYSAAINSSDRYFHELFPGLEFTSRVDFKPLGKTDGKYGNLILGTGINTGRRHENYTVGSAYAGYSYKKFAINAEYAIADGYNGKNFSSNKATGFNTTVSYRLTKRLHVLARVDQFDPNRDVGGDLRREYTAGLNYFIKGQALKLILNYVFCDKQNSQDSHRIILGTQILL